MSLLTPHIINHDEETPKLLELRDRTISGLGRLGAGLPEPLLQELAETLEIVNSYYSNSMEGNPTRIGEIFSAKQGDLADTVTERNYQLEHLAHIKTAVMMRAELQNNPSLSPASIDFLRMLHREFYSTLPEPMRMATLISGKSIPIIPGDLRHHEASVGHHHAIPVSQLNRCLGEFQNTYDPRRLSPQDQLEALAASHHRFLWIHPFADGNGRVARLMTDAMAIRMGYSGHHLYSISRGLARQRKNYDAHLGAADAPRRGDLDGHGNLSLKGLLEFSEFFIDVMADQIEFMSTLMNAPTMQSRFSKFLNLQRLEKTLSESECAVLRYLLRSGEMRRGEIQAAAGVERRQASKIASRLLSLGYMQSDSPKGTLRLKAHRDIIRSLFPEFF